MLPKLDWNYFRAWYVLIAKHPSGMRMWLLSVEMLFVAFMIYIAFSTTAEIAEVEEYPVTIISAFQFRQEMDSMEEAGLHLKKIKRG